MTILTDPDRWLGLAGVTLLLVSVFWLIARGRIHTAREFDAMVTAKDQQIQYLTDAAIRKDEQIEKLMSAAQLSLHAMQALEDLARQEQRQ